MSRRGRLGIALGGALVLAAFAACTAPNLLRLLGQGPEKAYYNLQVEGFRAGRLDLARPVPAGLAALPDPWDPRANQPFRDAADGVHDLTFYRGRLYLYFGAAPALLLFWPYAALTGHFLYHSGAVLLFCAAGFGAGLLLLAALLRRHFPGLGAGTAFALTLALGLAGSIPLLLQRPDVWEVPIACSYLLEALALGALWRAIGPPEGRARWSAALGLCLGLSVGCRPHTAPAALLALLPAWAEWRERGRARVPRLLLAAGAPLAACALALCAYNAARFGDPLTFGQRYQLSGDQGYYPRHFSAGYLGYNLRTYFLEPGRWTAVRPFYRPPAGPPPPAGHVGVDPTSDPFALLPNIPFLLLALAAPLAWRGREPSERARLRRLAAALAWLFAAAAGPLLLYFGCCSRYEFEFLAPLLWLAILGAAGLERALAGRPVPRRWARAGWSALLLASLAFNAAAAAEHAAQIRYALGNSLLALGRPAADAAAQYQIAVELEPDFAEAHGNLGVALLRAGRLPEAILHDREAVRLRPGSAGAHFNLAGALRQAGATAEAASEYGAAQRLLAGAGR
ncbi:MAG TPA: tetratricopeptide repeat protein [Opitutaceae bacterium]|nr:tetratricopeptide repeat protein [Opitutaceae bacterium]